MASDSRSCTGLAARAPYRSPIAEMAQRHQPLPQQIRIADLVGVRDHDRCMAERSEPGEEPCVVVDRPVRVSERRASGSPLAGSRSANWAAISEWARSVVTTRSASHGWANVSSFGGFVHGRRCSPSLGMTCRGVKSAPLKATLQDRVLLDALSSARENDDPDAGRRPASPLVTMCWRDATAWMRDTTQSWRPSARVC